MRSGLTSWCRACAVERMRQWRADNGDYIERINAGRRVRQLTKRCANCGIEYTPARKDRETCSLACKRALKAVRERARRAASSRVNDKQRRT
jgi:hypothetical protein